MMPWATPTEYAKARGMDSHRVYNAIQRRGCPHIKVNNKIFLNVEEVDRWYDSHTKSEIPYERY